MKLGWFCPEGGGGMPTCGWCCGCWGAELLNCCMANWEASWLNIPPKEGLPAIAPKRVLCALSRCSSSFNASFRSANT